MSRWVNIHYRIISAIGIKVKSYYAFRLKITYTIGRNKPTKRGIIITALQIVERKLFIPIIATVAYGVDVPYIDNFRANFTTDCVINPKAYTSFYTIFSVSTI